MRQISLPGTPNSDLNARIAVGIIACFEPDLFSDSGCLPALWQARLTAGLVDVQGMVEDLLGSHPRTPEAPHSPAPHDWSAARRPPGTSGPLSSGRF
jgi:hypothetical protein